VRNYLVWSNEHNAWWRHNRQGYTPHLGNAGRYTREEAITICALSRDGWDGKRVPSEIPVSEEDIRACIVAFDAAMKSV
jgi:hypothetical protein